MLNNNYISVKVLPCKGLEMFVIESYQSGEFRFIIQNLLSRVQFEFSQVSKASSPDDGADDDCDNTETPT